MNTGQAALPWLSTIGIGLTGPGPPGGLGQRSSGATTALKATAPGSSPARTGAFDGHSFGLYVRDRCVEQLTAPTTPEDP
jgi:hypothetical protein